jgi:hypothetical protein
VSHFLIAVRISRDSSLVVEGETAPRITPGTTPGPAFPLPSLADTINKHRLTTQILNIATVARK